MAMTAETYANAKPPVPRQRPAFTSPLDNAVDEVRVLRQRIDSLAERLCGSVPENDAAGIASVPNGLFEHVERSASNISDNVSQARMALDRIEAALP